MKHQYTIWSEVPCSLSVDDTTKLHHLSGLFLIQRTMGLKCHGHTLFTLILKLKGIKDTNQLIVLQAKGGLKESIIWETKCSLFTDKCICYKHEICICCFIHVNSPHVPVGRGFPSNSSWYLPQACCFEVHAWNPSNPSLSLHHKDLSRPCRSS